MWCRYERACEAIKENSSSIGAIDRVEDISNVYAYIQKQKQQHNALRNTILYVQNTQTALHSLPNTKGLDRRIVVIETAYANLEARKQKFNSLHTMLSAIVEKNKRAQEAAVLSKQTAIQLANAMPNICPLCEQPIRRK
mgnify:CR=1 FL=1